MKKVFNLILALAAVLFFYSGPAFAGHGKAKGITSSHGLIGGYSQSIDERGDVPYMLAGRGGGGKGGGGNGGGGRGGGDGAGNGGGSGAGGRGGSHGAGAGSPRTRHGFEPDDGPRLRPGRYCHATGGQAVRCVHDPDGAAGGGAPAPGDPGDDPVFSPSRGRPPWPTLTCRLLVAGGWFLVGPGAGSLRGLTVSGDWDRLPGQICE